ncbi:MAG: transglutaminase domain-containing protein, partial [Coriobacteriia bacterium]|nr:transglutaminase domain-containing protein [Coriobacteriia bacterium]
AFRTNQGNCFNFAARFGFLAQAIGYDATIVRGHVRGRGGPIRHGWVEIRIGNRTFVYDPQLELQMGVSLYHMPRGRERLFYLR